MDINSGSCKHVMSVLTLLLCSATCCGLQVIWNSKMREEVLAQMERERKEGTAVPTADQDPTAEADSLATADHAATTATGFKFAALGKELVIAGVFVGVYNQQPNFPIADPAAFCRGLVTFVHSRMKPEVYYPSLPSKQHKSALNSTTAPAVHTQQSQVQGKPSGQSTMPQQDAQQQHNSAHQDLKQDKEQRARQEVVQALQALTHIMQAVPKLPALMASRPAITPLLNCLEPTCRSSALPTHLC